MQKIIIGNWKENPEGLEVARKLTKISEDFEEKQDKDFWFAFENKLPWPKNTVKIAHAVPNIFAEKLFLETRRTKIMLQNISMYESGSHTGEVSAKQMLDCGIQGSIVGHSETRLSPSNTKGDEDSDINLKIKNLIKNNCYALLCVGEYSRSNNFNYLEFVKTQIENSLRGLKREDLEKIMIAYEPVWAIGKDAIRTATNSEIIEVIKYIKELCKQKWGDDMGVLYGGSVDENNAKEILNLEGVDGLLVGRASSNPETWEKLLKNLADNPRDQILVKKALNYKSVSDLEILSGDIVLLRLDLNVPTNEAGEVMNDFRIQESLQTIKYLQEKNAKTIILAHKEKGSLEQVANHIQNKIKLKRFKFINKVTGTEVEGAVKSLQAGETLLIDNLRLDEREKKNEPEFAKYFINLAKQNIKNSKSLFGIFAFGKETVQPKIYYINEAFSASHRKHASIVGIPAIMKDKGIISNCALGFKFIEEIDKLSLVMEPKHPMLMVIGGAKFETKLNMLNKFIDVADKIFIGGALAHNFWKQKFNFNLGKSLIDEEVKLDNNILDLTKLDGSGIIVTPTDVIIESRETKKPDEILDNEKIVDFGENTLKTLINLANTSKTIVWNGPLGFYEGGFEWGTKSLLLGLNDLQKKHPEKVIILGGGDTVTEIDKLNEDLVSGGNEKLKFTHVSTGGGAMIDFLSEGTLPGIDVILQ